MELKKGKCYVEMDGKTLELSKIKNAEEILKKINDVAMLNNGYKKKAQ